MKKALLSFAVFGCFATSALAEGVKAPAAAEMTREQRQQMAGAHEKMAACLRSEKPLTECHSEMMKSCEATMGANGCPMMQGKMGKMGSMKHHSAMAPGATNHP